MESKTKSVYFSSSDEDTDTEISLDIEGNYSDSQKIENTKEYIKPELREELRNISQHFFVLFFIALVTITVIFVLLLAFPYVPKQIKMQSTM